MKRKNNYVKLDDNFSKFLIKHAVIASAFTFLLGYQLRELISVLIDTIIKPLFSIDLNADGEPDLKQIKNFTTNVLGIKYLFINNFFYKIHKILINYSQNDNFS